MDEEQAILDFQSMFVPADLHPDLTPYINDVGRLGDCLQHPLIYSVPYTPQMNSHYNKRYEMLKEAVAKALQDGKPHSYVFMHERPYRFNAFVEYTAKRTISDEDYWELLGSMWTDSENIWQNLSEWKRLLRSKRSCKHMFMDEDDRKAFQELPGQFTVYRGCIRGQNEDGVSWTLDRKRAIWFSKRFERKGESPRVLEKTIPKRRAFAYLNGRGEAEVIVL